MNTHYKNLNIPQTCNLPPACNCLCNYCISKLYRTDETGWINTSLIKNKTPLQWTVLKMHKNEVMSSLDQGRRHTNWIMLKRAQENK